MGESSFWYRPTRVVPDQRPLNGRCIIIYIAKHPRASYFVLHKCPHEYVDNHYSTDVIVQNLEVCEQS